MTVTVTDRIVACLKGIATLILDAAEADSPATGADATRMAPLALRRTPTQSYSDILRSTAAMNSPLVRVATLARLVIAIAACTEATASTLDEVLANRALWSAQNLTDYSYHYEVTGLLISWEGHEISLDIRDGAVASAVFVATGQQVPGPPTEFPTIEALFDLAAQAARDRNLTSITFHPLLHYPVRMD